MKSMDSAAQPGIMATLSNRKGFSLVEMAVVLIVIGIIIGAVLKGQDLIVNAKAKKVISDVSAWRILTLAYMDRTGRLPGDIGKDGVIGNQGLQTGAAYGEYSSAGSATKEISNSMSNAPANPIMVGGLTYYVFFGNARGLTTPNRNVIVLCKNSLCNADFTPDDIIIFKMMDVALDGSEGAGVGAFRAGGTSTTEQAITESGNPITNTTLNPSVTLAAFLNHSASVNATTGAVAGSTITWDMAGIKTAVWAFDQKF